MVKKKKHRRDPYICNKNCPKLTRILSTQKGGGAVGGTEKIITGLKLMPLLDVKLIKWPSYLCQNICWYPACHQDHAELLDQTCINTKTVTYSKTSPRISDHLVIKTTYSDLFSSFSLYFNSVMIQSTIKNIFLRTQWCSNYLCITV